MQFTLTVAALAASAMALNATNGTHNGTSAVPSSGESAASNTLVNAGVVGAVVAGGIALML